MSSELVEAAHAGLVAALARMRACDIEIRRLQDEIQAQESARRQADEEVRRIMLSLEDSDLSGEQW